MKQEQPYKNSGKPAIADAYGLRRRLVCWFDQPLGRLLQAAITSHLNAVLPSLFGNTILQLGRIGHMPLMDESVAPTSILLDIDPLNTTSNAVSAQSHELPFDARSIDIAILPHTLDFADDPHRILREIDRVLSPDGHVVIVGFNPYSFWGLRHLFSRKHKQVPWNARYFSTTRIKDWMSLLSYEIQSTQPLFYRPPLKNQKLMQRLFFLEKLGGRMWPQVAAVYVIVAKKQMLTMTPIQTGWKSRKNFIHGLTEPAAKVIHPRVPQWRLHRDSQG